MNDFLGKLVSRSLNPMAAVRPRLPSLFEPLNITGAASVAAFEPESEALPLSERVRRTPLSSVNPRLRSTPPTPDSLYPIEIRPELADQPPSDEGLPYPDPDRPSTALTQEPARLSQRRDQTGIAWQQHDTQTSRQPMIEPAAFPGETQPQPPAGTIRPSIMSVPHGGSPAQPVAVEPVISLEEGQPPAIPASGSTSPGVTALSQVIPGPCDEPVTVPGETQPQIRAATIVARPQVIPVPHGEPATSSPTAQPATEPEPAPTIRVTIGQVEVRAVMPPPTPPPRRVTPLAPKLSLDDYLKRRSGGQK